MLYEISCKYIVIINSTYKSCKVSMNTTLYTLFLYFYPMTNERTLHTPWVADTFHCPPPRVTARSQSNQLS